MNITSRQLAKIGVKIRGSAAMAVANNKRVKINGEYDSKTEALYAQRLDLMQKAGEIRSWIPHPFTLKLADDARYTPDFLVWHNDNSTEIIEVKGFQRSRDVVRWKWARDRFPMFRWSMVQRDGSRGWRTIRS